jgi:hypothetical protein
MCVEKFYADIALEFCCAKASRFIVFCACGRKKEEQPIAMDRLLFFS